MFDLGLSKIAVIGVVGLIVLGPERLPRVARVVGTLFGRAQRYLRDVKDEVARDISLAELKEMGDSVNQQVVSVQQDIAQTWQATSNDVVNTFEGSANTHQNRIGSSRFVAPAAAATRTGRAHWRVRTGRVPLWFKQSNRIPMRISTEAARMAKHRRYAAHLNKKRHSFFV